MVACSDAQFALPVSLLWALCLLILLLISASVWLDQRYGNLAEHTEVRSQSCRQPSPESSFLYSARLLRAWRAGVCDESLEFLMQEGLPTSRKSQQRRTEHFAQGQVEGTLAIQQLVGSSCFSRVLKLFAPLHPWLNWRLFSLHQSHAERVAAVIGRLLLMLLGVAALTRLSEALQLTGVGEQCEPRRRHFEGEVGRVAAVGILGGLAGGLAGEGAMLLIQSLSACVGGYRYIFWTAWAVSCSGSLAILQVNMTSGTQAVSDWLAGTIAVLCQEFLLAPLLTAIYLAVSLSRELQRDPQIAVQQEEAWQESLVVSFRPSEQPRPEEDAGMSTTSS
eukprot:TRINITY_DN28817_c0_g1_i1.p1 TRINITY_DN28817_c0_g1~~TRINITY_DN28817_c0_g1_i1.p1  ORF type:complete len:335 (+),score=47.34 TRINITY_DN28817_c0_g1_i1:117-1121(+)